MPRAPRRSVSVLLPWAAALFVGLGAGGWSIKERRLREQETAAARETEKDLRRQLAERDERLGKLEERARTGSPTDGISIWRLSPGVERGISSAQPFVVAADWIRLRLPLEHDPKLPTYRASLQTATGKPIRSEPGLRAQSGQGGPTIDLVVPGGLLPPGTYLFAIYPDVAGTELITATTFVVR